MKRFASGFVFVMAGAFALSAAAAMAAEKGTPAEAQALLDKAVKAVQTDGKKALASFNDPKGGFIDRDLYVFCFGPDGKITAHREASRVGTDVAAIKDPDGKEIGKQMLALGAKGEGSVEYKWPNPVTNKVETKVSYIKKAGDQVCGVGAYK
jgi:signal transduction histidine kinase